MSKRSNDFEVIEGYHRTAAFLAPLQDAADAHRQELGFFAKSVYEEFARNDLLFDCGTSAVLDGNFGELKTRIVSVRQSQ